VAKGTRRGAAGGRAERQFPSRAEVLAFLAENPGSAGKRDVARAFGIKGTAARIALRALLADLASEGLVQKKAGRLKRPADLPSLAVLSVTGRDSDGDLLAEPVDWPSDQPAPRVVITYKRDGVAPGVGDRILARISPGESGGQYFAAPVKVLGGAPETVIGVVRRGPHEARLEPVDRKQKEVIALLLAALSTATPWIMSLQPWGPVGLAAGYTLAIGYVVYAGGDYVDWFWTGERLNLVPGVRTVVRQSLSAA